MEHNLYLLLYIRFSYKEKIFKMKKNYNTFAFFVKM